MNVLESTDSVTCTNAPSASRSEGETPFSFVLAYLKIALRGLLAWLPPSITLYIYTVLLRPAPLRRIAQQLIKHCIPRTMEFRGSRIVLNQDDAIVSGSLALGSYEIFVTEVLEALLRPGMRFLDVGANIGIYTALAARRVGPSGRVIAVEPSPLNASIIQETLLLNAFKNVTVAVRAAGDRAGEASLYVSDENPADHRLHDPTGLRRRLTIQTITLDALTAECGVERADVIKIDTQGWEAAVFGGMKRLLSTNPPPVIVTEFWPWGLAQAASNPRVLLDLFVASGFEIYEIDSDRRKIVRRTDLDQLTALKLERQHVNLLLTHSSRIVGDLLAAVELRA